MLNHSNKSRYKDNNLKLSQANANCVSIEYDCNISVSIKLSTEVLWQFGGRNFAKAERFFFSLVQ